MERGIRAFRGGDAPASLKHDPIPLVCHVIPSFPGRRRPGLIEAFSVAGIGIHHAINFPGRRRPGLIEAARRR